MDLYEAQAAIVAEARKVFEKKMRPDGYVCGAFVFDDRFEGTPTINFRLYANGTWEYEDGSHPGDAEPDPE